MGISLAETLTYYRKPSRKGFVVVPTSGNAALGGLIRRIRASRLERRKVQGVAGRRDVHHFKTTERKTTMQPSIYDFRDAEIVAARQIRRDSIRATVEAIVGVPLLVAFLAALILA